MDEITFYNYITGEWICCAEEKILIFKYDGFRMYKREEEEWVETFDWDLVKLSENSEQVTGIFFRFLGLDELLLKDFNEQKQTLYFEDMLPEHATYYFKKFTGTT
jgi:hypothetical protein